MDTLQFVDEFDNVLNFSKIPVSPLQNTGLFELIVEGDGNLVSNKTKVYLKAGTPLLLSGKCVVLKRQMNTAQSDDTFAGGKEILYTDLNSAVGNKILLHSWGVSENPVSFKILILQNFTPVITPVSGSKAYVQRFSKLPQDLNLNPNGMVNFELLGEIFGFTILDLNRVTCNVSGKYLFNYHACLSETTLQNNVSMVLSKNNFAIEVNGSIFNAPVVSAGSLKLSPLDGCGIVNLIAGETIEFKTKTSTGAGGFNISNLGVVNGNTASLTLIQI